MADNSRLSKTRKNDHGEAVPGGINDADRQDGEEDDEIEWFIYTGQSRNEISHEVTHVKIAITRIRDDAFRELARLCSVIIPDTVTVIGEWAFYRCKSLSTVSIPESVTDIEAEAFRECSTLETVHLCEGLERIERGAFHWCTSLKNIEFPQGLEGIELAAFASCRSLCEISLPGTVCYIGEQAFRFCTALRDVRFQEGLEVLDYGAFTGCTALEAIALPSSLREIKEHVFHNCTRLMCAEFQPGTKVESDFGAFAGCSSLVNVSIPESAKCPYSSFELCSALRGIPIRSRYAKHPVHNICYNSTHATVDDLNQALASCNDKVNKHILQDRLGLTPFHVVVTSANPRADLLECLLDAYPHDILDLKDKNGKNVLDYLMIRTTTRFVPLLQMILHKAIVERVSSWCKGTQGPNELKRCMQPFQNIGGENLTKSRFEIIQRIMECAGHYTRVEVTSLLELAVWKTKLAASLQGNGSSEDNSTFRDSCRCHSGIQVVMDNVLSYMWTGGTKTWTARSTFPILSSMDKEKLNIQDSSSSSVSSSSDESPEESPLLVEI